MESRSQSAAMSPVTTKESLRPQDVTVVSRVFGSALENSCASWRSRIASLISRTSLSITGEWNLRSEIGGRLPGEVWWW